MTPPPPRRDNTDRAPERMAHDDADCEVRLALVEERHAQIRTDVTSLCTKVDRLCDEVAPIVPWVRTQMSDAQAESDWRKGLFRDIKKYIVMVATVSIGTLVLTRPHEMWGIVLQVGQAVAGGSP